MTLKVALVTLQTGDLGKVKWYLLNDWIKDMPYLLERGFGFVLTSNTTMTLHQNSLQITISVHHLL